MVGLAMHLHLLRDGGDVDDVVLWRRGSGVRGTPLHLHSVGAEHGHTWRLWGLWKDFCKGYTRPAVVL